MDLLLRIVNLQVNAFNFGIKFITLNYVTPQNVDITPNGTLRRRRSRVLSEEDEGNLLDFLRSSGHDSSTRERKGASYGSLDRSWARRARSGSSGKKRPDLLNVDFNADRERPSSPSPLAESKPLPGEPQDVRPRYVNNCIINTIFAFVCFSIFYLISVFSKFYNFLYFLQLNLRDLAQASYLMACKLFLDSPDDLIESPFSLKATSLNSLLTALCDTV